MAPLYRLPRLLLLFLLFSLISCVRARSAAPEKWIEVRSPHFTVVSDAGEKKARETANQFEQIREVFHTAFPALRVDIGKPVIIFALKNENSMKIFLPAYWEAKGHAHPAGVYIPGEDKHCAIVRTNVESENPYQVVYHEYAHALENLNFQGLPLWLSEGIAEYLGNSRIFEGFVEIGVASRHHLTVLSENKLIPIDVLLGVDSNSPYYNEQSRVSLFYAESWVLVHYLLMDLEAQQEHLLQNFLTAYQSSGDQLQAARQSFGDLSKFAQSVEQYSRHQPFLVGRVNTSVRVDSKSFTSRVLSPAEVNARRGDLYTRTHRPVEAKSTLEMAVRQDPNLALAHEGLGFLALSQQDMSTAEVEFTKAVQLNSQSFLAYYFSARVRMRDEMNSKEEIGLVLADLEKAIDLNPQFAPAYDALSSIYSLTPETADKAVAAARKAIQLEPGTLSYALNYGYVLLRIGKIEDAKSLAGKIQTAAKTAEDHSAAQRLAALVAQRERYDDQLAARPLQPEDKNAKQVPATSSHPPGSGASGFSYEPPSINNHPGEDEFAMDGTIISAECPSGSAGKVLVQANNKSFLFTIPSIRELQVLLKNDDVSAHPPVCTEWKGRHARLFFYKLKDKRIFGELSTIQFF